MKFILKILIALIPIKKWRKKARKYVKNNSITSDYSIVVDKNNNKYPKLIDGLLIKINGANNTLEIENGVIFAHSYININSNNSKIVIKKAKYIKKTNISIYNGDNQTLEIGEDTTIENARFFLCSTGGKTTIGDDCMFSSEIQVWSGDGHQIIDKKTGKILNEKPIDLTIGNHCWIAFGSKILKNAKIPNNSIVAAQSVVSKKFEEENTVIAGNTAKVVKTEVEWKREDPYTKRII